MDKIKEVIFITSSGRGVYRRWTRMIIIPIRLSIAHPLRIVFIIYLLASSYHILFKKELRVLDEKLVEYNFMLEYTNFEVSIL